ncbi:MAG: hypothetical protein WC998_01430 [Candidatus Paceibacterota bacterium]|jgi:hypothetical protein
MKILSTTIQEGRVVELTREEWIELKNLAYSLEGKTEQEIHWNFGRENREIIDLSINFSGVFGAIQAFYEAKFRTNEMQSLLDKMKAFLNETPK